VPITVGLSASPTQIHEGQSATYTVRASSAVLQATTVAYAMSGTAILGTDYVLSGSTGNVTIGAGQSSAIVTLKAKTDSLVENTETAVMTLQPGTGYKLGKVTQATISILDGP
jgi:hypothetical protein